MRNLLFLIKEIIIMVVFTSVILIASAVGALILVSNM